MCLCYIGCMKQDQFQRIVLKKLDEVNGLGEGLDNVSERLGGVENVQKEVVKGLDNVEKGQSELSGRLGKVEKGQSELSGRLGKVEKGQSDILERLDDLEDGIRTSVAEGFESLTRDQNVLKKRVDRLEEVVVKN